MVTWKNILPRVHGWIIFMDENVCDNENGWTFSWTLATSVFWQKLNKRNNIGRNYVGLFIKNCHMKCWNHISTSTSYFHNTKYIMFCNIQTIENFKFNQIQSHINLLIHQELCVNSNTTCSPQRGMRPFGIETIWSSPWHITI